MISDDKPASIDSSGRGDVVVSSEVVNNTGVEEEKPFNEAEIIIEGTKCKRCCEQVDLKKEAIKCFKCNQYFHGVCYRNQHDISSPSALAGHLAPAVSKSGSYEKRFGHFLFFCSPCYNEFSEHNHNSLLNFDKSAQKSYTNGNINLQNKVELLSSDVTNLKTDLTDQIASLKAMVSKLTENTTAVEQHQISDSEIAENTQPSFAEIITSSILPPQQKQQLIHISTNNADNLSSEELKEKVSNVKTKISEGLKDIPTNFVKTNSQKGSVTVAFPDTTTREKGSRVIDELNLSDSGFQSKQGKKMLPKVTVAGVDPSLLDNVDPNLPLADKRQQQKLVIRNSIICKNDCIKVLTDIGHTLEVVYLNKPDSSHWMTIALKVSPAIRNSLFKDQQGYIFIGNNSLPIEDRFFFKQCFHCQQVGHVSSTCPKLAESPVCFYCMGPHKSKLCTKKKMPSEQCCSKCFHSTVPGEKGDYKSHNAADPQCPVVLREIQKIASNTDIISKNVM